MNKNLYKLSYSKFFIILEQNILIQTSYEYDSDLHPLFRITLSMYPKFLIHFIQIGMAKYLDVD
jgi:hypothetical protein